MSTKFRYPSKLASARVVFFVSAVLTWPIMAELELFERFHEFSRAHENWDLDEFALLILNLTLALLVSTIYQGFFDRAGKDIRSAF